ncbi:hypothetical protein Q6257_29135, partial [Klebsiella variicola]|nr:hypothetical protein [Klebsiella variicola]
QLYHAPQNRFVAGFIGSPRMNFMAVSASASGVDCSVQGPGNLSFDVTLPGAGMPAEIGIRPEALSIAAQGQGKVTGTLERLEDLG